MIFEFGENWRTIRHISRALPMLGMMAEIPTMSYCSVVTSRWKRSSVGKSSTVHGAEILCWIMVMPQERWNMRKEKLPWARVTWLW